MPNIIKPIAPGEVDLKLSRRTYTNYIRRGAHAHDWRAQVTWAAREILHSQRSLAHNKYVGNGPSYSSYSRRLLDWLCDCAEWQWELQVYAYTKILRLLWLDGEGDLFRDGLDRTLEDLRECPLASFRDEWGACRNLEGFIDRFHAGNGGSDRGDWVGLYSSFVDNGATDWRSQATMAAKGFLTSVAEDLGAEKDPFFSIANWLANRAEVDLQLYAFYQAGGSF